MHCYLRVFLGFCLAACLHPVYACGLSFSVEGEQVSYPYSRLTDFIRDKIRANVTPTNNELERYRIIVTNLCSPAEAEKTISASLTIQKNTVYIKELNGIPLCKEKMTSSGLHCEKGQYNFVDYKGGAALIINEETTQKALHAVADISLISQLEEINSIPDRQNEVHNAIRLFAMLLAESSRFDYVLDDLDCAIRSKGFINFMDYWGLVHNWGTIASRVSKKIPAMEGPNTKKGVGSLFVPITRDMVSYFNNSLNDDPPHPEDVTPDGKNKAVSIRTPNCNLSPFISNDANFIANTTFSAGLTCKELLSQANWLKSDLYTLTYQCTPPGWETFFGLTEIKNQLKIISDQLKNEAASGTIPSPTIDSVFRAMYAVEPRNIKVVILGQDPAPQKGQATGLSFSLKPGVPPSTTPSVQRVMLEAENEGYCMDMKNGDLSTWAESGALMLNTALTLPCPISSNVCSIGGHLPLWTNFSRHLIEFIETQPQAISYILWGSKAVALKSMIRSPTHITLIGGHPSPEAPGENFFCKNYFKNANKWLTKHGRTEIIWNTIKQCTKKTACVWGKGNSPLCSKVCN